MSILSMILVFAVAACETSGPRPVTSTARCAPWSEAKSLLARMQAGRGDFFRELRYDFAAGEVSVNDSDPFATGKEEKTPRVIQRSRTLTPEEKAKTEAALFAICPSEEARKARCAPGGCMRLEVAGTALEHAETVERVMKILADLFPELRR
jgi:hypothetical protein